MIEYINIVKSEPLKTCVERGELLPPRIALARLLPSCKKRLGKRASLVADEDGVFLLKGDEGERVRLT